MGKRTNKFVATAAMAALLVPTATIAVQAEEQVTQQVPQDGFYVVDATNTLGGNKFFTMNDLINGDSTTFEDLIDTYGFENIYLIEDGDILNLGDALSNGGDFAEYTPGAVPAGEYAPIEGSEVESVQEIAEPTEAELAQAAVNTAKEDLEKAVAAAEAVKAIEVPTFAEDLTEEELATAIEAAEAAITTATAEVAAAKAAVEAAEAALTTAKAAAVEAGIAEDTLPTVDTAKATEAIAVAEAAIAAATAAVEEAGKKEATELTVESVSAINDTGVTINVTALTGDLEGATVEVKDSKGNVVAVEAVDLSAGETTVEFAFVTEVKEADLIGVWTVDGIEYDLSLANNLAAFEAATTQLAIYAALEDLGIENLSEDNAAAYADDKEAFLTDLAAAEEKELTVAAIQAFVDEVNASQITAEEEATIVAAVVDADGNNLKLKAALANAAFTKVNNEWIEDSAEGAADGYAAKLAAAATATTLTEDSAIEDVQAIIDDVNETKIAEEITAVGPTTSVDKAKLAKLKTLIETYAPVDEDGEYVTTTNQDAIDAIVEQTAVADVLAATTASKFKSTVTALAAIVNEGETTPVIDLEEYVDADGKKYIDKIAAINADDNVTVALAGVTAKVDTAAEVELVIAAVNQEVEEAAAVAGFTKLETAIDALDATAPTATQKTNFINALTALEIEEVSTNKDNVDAYVEATRVAAILAESVKVTDSDNVDPTAITPVPGNAADAIVEIQKVVDAANIAVVDAATKDGIVAALTVIGTENVVAANAEAYVTAVNGLTTKATIQTAVGTVNKEAAVKAAVKAINEATTATAVKAALDAIANENLLPAYLNVATVDRIFLAEQVLELRENDTHEGEYEVDAVATEVVAVIGTAEANRQDALTEVNNLVDFPGVVTSTLTEVAQALILVGHKSITGSFDSDTGFTVTAKDTEIAEKFFAKLTFGDPTVSPTVSPKFTSISAIRAVLDGLK